MKLPVLFAALFLTSVAPAESALKVPAPSNLQRFWGQIKTVDRSARTITIEMPMRFVFHIGGSTRITDRGGATATFDQISAGVGADVVARHEGNKWTALTIKLDRGAHFPDEISARTVQGKRITGPAVGEYIVFKPPIEVVNRNINFGQNSGLFLVSVAADGTVGNVQVLKSLGLQELNERALRWLRKWRFRPNSITEARIPVSYNSYRRY